MRLWLTCGALAAGRFGHRWVFFRPTCWTGVRSAIFAIFSGFFGVLRCGGRVGHRFSGVFGFCASRGARSAIFAVFSGFFRVRAALGFFWGVRVSAWAARDVPHPLAGGSTSATPGLIDCGTGRSPPALPGRRFRSPRMAHYNRCGVRLTPGNWPRTGRRPAVCRQPSKNRRGLSRFLFR